MRAKIGLVTAEAGDRTLVKALLAAMQESAADFTLTFRLLADAADDVQVQVPGIKGWLATWRARLQLDPQQPEVRAAAMRLVNPAFIARNHRVEAALEAASQDGNFAPLERLLTILRRPYDEQPDALEYARAPMHSERVLNTFCGT